MLIMPLLKSMSDHSSPNSSQSLTPVNIVSIIATLYLISSADSSFKPDIRVLHC